MGDVTALESTLERSFVCYVEQQGHFAIKILKRGWPDRLIQLGCGYSFYIEFKREGEEAGKLQKHMHKVIRSRGTHVYVCNGFAHAKNILDYELEWSEKTNQMFIHLGEYDGI